MVRPRHLQAMRGHLVESWAATVSDGIEADDAVSIAAYNQYGSSSEGSGCDDGTVVAHIDKDLDLIGGHHYNFNKKEWYYVSEQETIRNFFVQLMKGDRADNIPGFDGKMRLKWPKKFQDKMDFLEANYTDRSVMLIHVMDMYNNWDKFNISATCLWLLREEDDTWQNHFDPNLLKELKNAYSTGGNGLLDGLTHSSLASYEAALAAGPLNSSV